ncbi:MAG: methylated-DNA--[protein]-cysteine S-methyltransferase [Proteobacteria bacterium]|nr:methylated-DNA--[protein]-cysteine S-methyltransferase [Pseudomonadota bacterium]
MTTYYTYTQSPVGRLMLTASDHALTGLYFSTGNKARTTPDDSWCRNDSHFRQARQELDEYFEHRRRCFEVALEPCATPFQSRVLDALRAIPYGEVRSYKQIAEAIGSPKAMRAVGNANGNNPLAIFIPCHRVVGSNGALTGFGGGLEAKQYLLGLELD